MAAPDAVAVQAPNLQSSTFIISRRTENTRIRGVNKNRAAIHNTCCTYTASIIYCLTPSGSSVSSLLFLHKQCQRVRCDNKHSPFALKTEIIECGSSLYSFSFVLTMLFRSEAKSVKVHCGFIWNLWRVLIIGCRAYV